MLYSKQKPVGLFLLPWWIFLFLFCKQNENYEIIHLNSNKSSKAREFIIQKLEFNYLYDLNKKISIPKSEVFDEHGISMKEFRGNKYYSPVKITQHILDFLYQFTVLDDSAYLNKAEKFTDKLLEISHRNNDAIYFPYNFDWFLHQNKYDILNRPWYSGIAQGQALSVFVRLYRITNDKKYLGIAEKVFKSFLYTKNLNYDPWIALIDEQGFYWIEEYPCESPTHVLNGFLHGIFGLYDYYLITNSAECKKILLVALTTIFCFIEEYREKNDLSYYCLKHKAQYENYHLIHIDQLKLLHKITGEKRFEQFSIYFYNDYKNYKRATE